MKTRISVVQKHSTYENSFAGQKIAVFEEIQNSWQLPCPYKEEEEEELNKQRQISGQ